MRKVLKTSMLCGIIIMLISACSTPNEMMLKANERKASFVGNEVSVEKGKSSIKSERENGNKRAERTQSAKENNCLSLDSNTKGNLKANNQTTCQQCEDKGEESSNQDWKNHHAKKNSMVGKERQLGKSNRQGNKADCNNSPREIYQENCQKSDKQKNQVNPNRKES